MNTTRLSLLELRCLEAIMRLTKVGSPCTMAEILRETAVSLSWVQRTIYKLRELGLVAKVPYKTARAILPTSRFIPADKLEQEAACQPQ